MGNETDGLLTMDEIGPVVDRVQELAVRYLPAPMTTEIRIWDDGDCSLRTFHTYWAENGNIEERSEIRYWPDSERIGHRYYQFHKVDAVYLEEEVTPIETYKRR